MKFTFTNNSRGPSFSLHRAGCPDVERNRMYHNGVWTVTAESVESALAGFVADMDADEMGYTADDVKVYPCARARHT